MSNAKIGLHWHFSVENGVCISIADNLYDIIFLHVVDTSDKLFVDRNLVVSLLIHEDVVLSFKIEILIGTALNTHILKCFTNVETLFKYTTIYYVLKGSTHDGVSFSWFYVQEVDAEVQLTIHADACTFFNVL